MHTTIVGLIFALAPMLPGDRSSLNIFRFGSVDFYYIPLIPSSYLVLACSPVLLVFNSVISYNSDK